VSQYFYAQSNETNRLV